MTEETYKKPESKSNDRDYALRMYLQEISQYTLLTREQEIEIGRKSFRGNRKARELMTNSNLRLVVKVARDYENRGVKLMDLIQEGNIGLMRAVKKYNPDKKSKVTKKPVKFSTYACWWISQFMRVELYSQGRDIHLPTGSKAEMNFIYLDDATNKSIGEYRENGEEMHQHLQSEEPMPSQVVIREEKINIVRESLEALDERERKIIEMRFGLNGNPEMTLREVGKRFGITRERIRQIEYLAKKRLSRQLDNVR